MWCSNEALYLDADTFVAIATCQIIFQTKFHCWCCCCCKELRWLIDRRMEGGMGKRTKLDFAILSLNEKKMDRISFFSLSKHFVFRSDFARSLFVFLKNGQSPASFIIYFRSFQTNTTIFTTIYVKNVHPVSSTGIRTHYLLNVSLLP